MARNFTGISCLRRQTGRALGKLDAKGGFKGRVSPRPRGSATALSPRPRLRCLSGLLSVLGTSLFEDGHSINYLRQ